LRTTYNKLIRDRIPEIITESGSLFHVELLEERAYRQALATKLVEEAQEFEEVVTGNDQAKQDGLMRELADLREVIDALMVTYGLDEKELLALQGRRRAERGGFEKRLKLLWVEKPRPPGTTNN